MDLTKRTNHFEFGANWSDYSQSINQQRIDAAVTNLRRLFPEGLARKTVVDIGCGSGLHSLAALNLGATSVLSIDIDERSVATTEAVLKRFAPEGTKWKTQVLSIFDTPLEMNGQFDVVYSWGVLHHTGAMWRAIQRASELVKPNGHFAVAIYAKTLFDAAWKIEKRMYSRAPKAVQWAIRQPYLAALLAGVAAKGKNPVTMLQEYTAQRGMRFQNDVHDWLGGYPYETASADEMQSGIEGMGFKEIRSFRLNIPLAGLFGSGCNEHVFERIA